MSRLARAFAPLVLAADPSRQRIRSTPERFWARVDRSGPAVVGIANLVHEASLHDIVDPDALAIPEASQ